MAVQLVKLKKKTILFFYLFVRSQIPAVRSQIPAVRFQNPAVRSQILSSAECRSENGMRCLMFTVTCRIWAFRPYIRRRQVCAVIQFISEDLCVGDYISCTRTANESHDCSSMSSQTDCCYRLASGSPTNLLSLVGTYDMLEGGALGSPPPHSSFPSLSLVRSAAPDHQWGRGDIDWKCVS